MPYTDFFADNLTRYGYIKNMAHKNEPYFLLCIMYYYEYEKRKTD